MSIKCGGDVETAIRILLLLDRATPSAWAISNPWSEQGESKMPSKEMGIGLFFLIVIVNDLTA